MHRRLWLLAGAALALLVVGATASASTSVATAPKLAAAPFAQSWANVPRTPAGRKAKSVLVFGMEQDVTGFNTGLRPNVAANCQKEIEGSAQSRLSKWFNTSCFSVPAAFTFGSESRTDPNLRGHGTANYDFALFKRTALTERTNLEFRVESFNLFNRVRFGPPDQAFTTAAANV